MTTTTLNPAPQEVVDRLVALEQLDDPAKKVGRFVRGLLGPGPVKDALSGTWLGHALHPVLTDLPIGTWTSAVLLDWLGGRNGRAAADRLIGLGLLSSGPVFWTGWSEWADAEPGSDSVRRIGVVHAAANGTAAALFGVSLLLRRRKARGAGKLVALAGTGALGAGGWLGGHLSYAEGVGVDQTVFEERPGEWTPVMLNSDLPDGESRYAEVDGVGVLVVRWEGELYGLSNRCSHRGGPLDEGELEGGCVTCPLHGSRFRLADGGVERGPAAYPQPRWDVRVSGGVVEVKAA